jgi:hypothetical protein
VAQRAKDMGRHPFGALLVAPDGETVFAMPFDALP